MICDIILYFFIFKKCHSMHPACKSLPSCPPYVVNIFLFKFFYVFFLLLTTAVYC